MADSSDEIDYQIMVRRKRCLEKLDDTMDTINLEDKTANDKESIEKTGLLVQEVAFDVSDIGNKLCVYSELFEFDYSVSKVINF